VSVQSQPREAEREALLAQLQRLEAELAAERAARQAAEQQDRQKDEFLAAVAHELRSPLGAILGWAHMLGRRGGEDELERGLEVIEQSVHVQSQLIDDLLVASRMASNRIRLHIEPVDPAAVVDAAVLSVRPAVAEKELRLTKILQPVGPVRGDAVRLQQVLCNLLTNAVKFTPRGGEVEIALRPLPGRAAISVKDTGIGIAPEFLPHVFERFRQHPSAARAHGGLGLGLAIARHLVELHGGEIAAESGGEGRGATFTVRLPLDEPLGAAA
jgi:signal transduction histidine kinase